MIAKDHRFHGLGSLRFAYTKGKTVRCPKMSLKYIENHRRQDYRLAVVVAKKVHKSAVVRNRIRRRIYAAVNGYRSTISKPYDLILSVYSDDIASMPAEDLAVTVKSLLEQAGVISLIESR